MKGLILMHINEAGAKAFEKIKPGFQKALLKKIYQYLSNNQEVYQIVPGSESALILSPYISMTTRITFNKNPYIQFFRCKRKMIFDKVDYAEICGWNMNVCVEQMQKILSFDTQYKTRWPDANALRWNEELYERVINHKIPSKALEELCF